MFYMHPLIFLYSGFHKQLFTNVTNWNWQKFLLFAERKEVSFPFYFLNITGKRARAKLLNIRLKHIYSPEVSANHYKRNSCIVNSPAAPKIILILFLLHCYSVQNIGCTVWDTLQIHISYQLIFRIHWETLL